MYRNIKRLLTSSIIAVSLFSATPAHTIDALQAMQRAGISAVALAMHVASALVDGIIHESAHMEATFLHHDKFVSDFMRLLYIAISFE